MKLIKLTQGYFAKVDDEDFVKLSKYKWRYSGRGYAVRYSSGSHSSRKLLFMHREILETPEDKMTDHVNRDKLDNRRTNLRIATNQENQRNQSLGKNNTTGYTGVSRRYGKYWAYIKVDYKNISLGRYEDLEDAVSIRKNAEIEFFGKFAGA